MLKVHFPARVGFHDTLKLRVDQYFDERGIPITSDWRMRLKTALLLALFFASYVFLVFFSHSLISVAAATFVIAQAAAMMGFNMMHDGAHGAYSKNGRVNWLMGFTMDFLGGSQRIWKHKHNILHHSYPNIDGLDCDIHSSGIMRLSPEQPWRPWHRFQHLYALPVYSLFTVSWLIYKDYRTLILGRVGGYKLPRLTFGDLALFFSTKAFYLGYMVVLPSFFHPVGHVLLTFLGFHLVLGLTFTLVFQLAHTVEGTAFPSPDPQTGAIQNEWAIHQVETSSNLAMENRLANWYMGGLNFQIEHHLFPRICHTHYPEISGIVEETCREFSVPYHSYPTVRAAVAGHFRLLKRLSMPAPLASAPPVYQPQNLPPDPPALSPVARRFD